MPTFCRHNRIIENCPICSKKPRLASSSRAAPRRASRASDTPMRAPRRSAATGMVTRRMERAPDDGYEHDLVPGLRSSVDAGRLADELAFSAARLRQIDTEPPGLFGEVASLDDREEACWLLFQIAYISPLEGDDPWASLRETRTTWASGQNPTDFESGPRSTYDPRRGDAGFTGYRAWAARAGGSQLAGLAGEASWTPQHRFDRAFERLALPGFGRESRLEFLVLAAHLGLCDLDPWTLHLSAAAATEPVALAAKRILGIGDLVLLQRRSRELASAVGVPVAALDLAFWNFSSPQHTSAGSSADSDPAEQARIRSALSLSPPQ